MISDFGVFMAFILMTVIDYAIGIPTPKLTVPSNFAVSISTFHAAGVSRRQVMNFTKVSNVNIF